MIWELVLTVMLNGEPREIDRLALEQEQTCQERAVELNGDERFTSYRGAHAFCRQIEIAEALPFRSTPPKKINSDTP